MTEVAFGAIGALVLTAGIMVVTSRNVVRAALWLVVVMGSLAAEFVLLSAPFVAWVQVLIYVGAVVVLVLFAVMLTQAPTGTTTTLDSPNRWVGAAVSLASFAALVAVLGSAFSGSLIKVSSAAKSGAAVTGETVFRFYTLPFELVSLLLLAALVGAIVLSRRDISGGEG